MSPSAARGTTAGGTGSDPDRGRSEIQFCMTMHYCAYSSYV